MIEKIQELVKGLSFGRWLCFYADDLATLDTTLVFSDGSFKRVYICGFRGDGSLRIYGSNGGQDVAMPYTLWDLHEDQLSKIYHILTEKIFYLQK